MNAAAAGQSAEDFGQRLQAARRAKGMTQKVLAERTGIPLNTIKLYEQGRNYPSVERVAVLCHVLDVGIDQLVPVDWRDH